MSGTWYRIAEDGGEVAARFVPEGATLADLGCSEAEIAGAEQLDCAPGEDLESRRARLWDEVKAKRDALEEGAAPTPVGPVQCDDRSKIKINGLVQMARIMGEAFEEEFTLADNSVVLLDAQMAIAMGVAVASHVSSIHACSRALRGRIEAAEDVAALEAIDIEAGWPGEGEA